MPCNDQTREKDIVQQMGATSQLRDVHTFGIFNLQQHGERMQYVLFTFVSDDIWHKKFIEINNHELD